WKPRRADHRGHRGAADPDRDGWGNWRAAWDDPLRDRKRARAILHRPDGCNTARAPDQFAPARPCSGREAVSGRSAWRGGRLAPNAIFAIALLILVGGVGVIFQSNATYARA